MLKRILLYITYLRGNNESGNGILRKVFIGVATAIILSILTWGTHVSYISISMAGDIEENRLAIDKEQEARSQQNKEQMREVKRDIKDIQKEQTEILKLLIKINKKTRQGI